VTRADRMMRWKAAKNRRKIGEHLNRITLMFAPELYSPVAATGTSVGVRVGAGEKMDRNFRRRRSSNLKGKSRCRQ
jgi:hypothetical protein